MIVEPMNTNFIPRVGIRMVREDTVKYPVSFGIGTVQAAADIAKSLIDQRDREILGVFCLDSQCRILNVSIVSVGTLDSAIASPRDIYKTAILCLSDSIILFHNHPSGSVSPSKEDCAITDKLVKLGKMMGIELVDHIIVNPFDNNYYSFHENKMINPDDERLAYNPEDICW